MIGRKQRNNALAVLLKAWRIHGNRRFRVDLAGPHYRPLKDAETLGWIWFDGDHCAILPAGIEALRPYDAGMSSEFVGQDAR